MTQTHFKKSIGKFISVVLMIAMLLSLAACGTVKSNVTSALESSLSETTRSKDDENDETEDNDKPSDTPAEESNSISGEGSPMFSVVLGTPSGLSSPSAVINDRTDGNEPNYSFNLIPLRDGVQFSVERIYSYDRHFVQVPYEVLDQFTASRDEYYRVNYFVDPSAYLYACVRIVARENNEQASFTLDPTEYTGSGGFTVWPDKIPDGLDESKIQMLSAMVAGGVWKYGQELGWTDDLGWAESVITPRQLALSQEGYAASLADAIYMGENVGPGDMPYYSVLAEHYAAALFPDVNITELAVTDSVTNAGYTPLTIVNTTQISLTAASVDGQTGHVIVSIVYENENGLFEDAFRVDWAAAEPFDVYAPFRYKLVGVMPLNRYPIGHAGFDSYTETYLGAPAAAALKKFGVTEPVGYLSSSWLWSAENTLLLKTIGTDDKTATYILIDDDEVNITYLGAATPPALELIPETPDDGLWTDLGIITIPTAWDYEFQIMDDVVVFAETTNASFVLYAGWLMADSIEDEVNRSQSYERFTFDDGHVGFILYFDEYITWLREDWLMLSLHHYGDISLYNNDKALILDIARSLGPA